MDKVDKMLIVAPMKRVPLLVGLLLLLAAPSFAQSSSFGFIYGGSERADDGLDLDFSNSVKEVFFSTELDEGTLFKIKAGKFDADFDEELEGELEYVQALVEYRFYEVFGSTGLYLGPGLYRARANGAEETEWGVEGGVNGTFPVTRRVGFLLQFGYHWVRLEERPTFFTAGAGIKLSF